MSLEKGVYQLKDGHWGYRFVIKCNGKAIDRKRTLDEFGQPFKTKQQAIRARLLAIEKERNGLSNEPSSPLQIERKTYKEVFEEYREKGRLDKAYGTIRKQDSLWENHIRDRYGDRFVDEVSVAEINDYLAQLYYQEGRSYSYVESFLKMFYLILGQAYSRNYMPQEVYAKLCLDKQARIKMPKKRLTEEDDINNAIDAMIGAIEYDVNTSLEVSFSDLGDMYKDKRVKKFVSDAICKSIKKRLNSLKIEIK